MIEYVDPIRFVRVAETGRTRPILASVEADSGEKIDAYIKVPGRCEFTTTGAVNEVIAAHVAAELGLPVCRPFYVRKSTEWIGTINELRLRDELQRSTAPWFASQSAGTQWSIWSSASRVDAENRATALSIITFDAIIDNGDRRASNSNLLTKSPDFRIIDHDMTFSFVDLFVPQTPPWELNGLSWLQDGDRTHALFSELRGSQTEDFDHVLQAWKGLSDQALDAVQACIPDSWNGGGRARRALDRVKEARDNIDACIDELCRVLS